MLFAQQSRILRALDRREEADVAASQALSGNWAVSDDSATIALRALDEGNYRDAAAAFQEAARSGAPRYSVWMGLAASEFKLRRFKIAIDALSAAAALRPSSPWPLYHRGVARIELHDPVHAAADFTRFLELVPNDPDGLLNRAAARFQSGDDRGAVADLDAAEKNGSRRTRLFALRSAAKRRLQDMEGADRDRATFLSSNPTDALSWNVRGEWKRDSRPRDVAGAHADFDAALALDPTSLPALRNKANLLSEDSAHWAEAIQILDRVLELAPESVGDRAGRTVLLSRVGRTEEALREVAACAAKTRDGMTLYQLASAALVAGDKSRGLALLRTALREDPAIASQMPDDSDLKSVQKDPEFLNLIAAAATLNN
jgi:tetratricopeptide (TPR) repeat protein